VSLGSLSNCSSAADVYADLFECEHEQRWHLSLPPLPPSHCVCCHTQVVSQPLLSQAKRASLSSQFVSCHRGIVVR
jgi:hypothetical protein